MSMTVIDWQSYAATVEIKIVISRGKSIIDIRIPSRGKDRSCGRTDSMICTTELS